LRLLVLIAAALRQLFAAQDQCFKADA
jgi:hypothetical protein